MTDQIAPSLATELEQAAKDFQSGLDLIPLGPRYDDETRKVIALLTRASALARAAEKVIDGGSPIWKGDCRYCKCDWYHGVPHTDDCAWMQLRALVSSGKGE